MEWIDRLNASIRYLEDHLTQEIDYSSAAQIACCSVCHYQRMFAIWQGSRCRSIYAAGGCPWLL